MTNTQRKDHYGAVRALYAKRLHDQGKTPEQIRAALKAYDAARPTKKESSTP